VRICFYFTSTSSQGYKHHGSQQSAWRVLRYRGKASLEIRALEKHGPMGARMQGLEDCRTHAPHFINIQQPFSKTTRIPGTDSMQIFRHLIKAAL
jgi:hypothetical protein